MTTLEFYAGYYGRILWKADTWVTDGQYEDAKILLSHIPEIEYNSAVREAVFQDSTCGLGADVPFDCWEDWAEFLEDFEFPTDLKHTNQFIRNELKRLSQLSVEGEVGTFLEYLKTYLKDSLELLGKEVWVNVGTGEVTCQEVC